MNLKSFVFGGFRLLVDERTPLALDPLTATNNMVGMLFNFLATPQGQLIVADIRKVNQNIATQISDLINHVHNQIPSVSPVVAQNVTKV